MHQRDWRHITEVTRRSIFDALRVGKHFWAGKLGEVEFLSRMFDLSSLPSGDSRHKDMAGDILRHRLWNPEVRWTPLAGQESERLKRESRRFQHPRPIRGVI